MRYYQFKLTEGSGLRLANPGEIYTDTNGDEYEFVEWDNNYPSNADKFNSAEEVQEAIAEITKQNPKIDIRWIKEPTRNMKCFAFAKFQLTDENSNVIKQVWLGNYYAKKSPLNSIKDGEARTVGLSAGGAASTSSVKGKLDSKLQPGDLGLGDNKSRSIDQIASEVSKDANNGPMLQKGIMEARNNEQIVFPGGAPIKGALQDDFMEIVAPIAIINDHQSVRGSHKVAIQDIFGNGANLDNSTIMFPEGQNNPLIDCYIQKDGIQMCVSHKGKTGANASISNIWKAKESAKKTQTGRSYIEKYAEAVEVLDICANTSASKQPLVLALRYGLISQNEADALTEITDRPADRYTPDQKLVGDRVVDEQKGPKVLLPLFKKIAYKKGSYFGLVALSSVAKDVALFINSDNATFNGKLIEFGEAIRKFLNASAMVQATSIVGTQNDDAVVKSIGIVYPPNFEGKATIENSPYYGTSIKSKFAFKLPKT